ncbi:hypothetical protein BJY52DRAFT_1302917 [Lactarius psammicola]|nr:hypothetical protein BJY52DRAFT_1302917 [Lactarius psammicola]
MSPAQSPSCTTNPRTYSYGGLYRSRFLHINTFHSGSRADEESCMTRKRVEDVTKYKLPTYQAAAVVSTVLSGVESQLLVFFKSFPSSTQQPSPAILQYLLLLTYVALIFSMSATISSLVLTENFGNVPMLVARFRENITTPKFETASLQERLSDNITPRRWRWIEWHWLFTLLVSMLCLPAQILLYIWMEERDGIRAAVSVASVFAMLPLLHFIPITWDSPKDNRKHESALLSVSYARHWANSLGSGVLPAPVSFPQVPHLAPPASQLGH